MDLSFLNEYFSKIYVISVSDERKNRLKSILDNYNIKYKFVKGVSVKDDIKENIDIRLTKGGISLLKTSEKIIEEAKKNNYKNILIFEDDIEFHPQTDWYLSDALKVLPKDYDLFFLGLFTKSDYSFFTKSLVKPTSGLCCHAYSINNHIYDILLEKIKQYDKPIDHYTNEIISEKLNSYAIKPSMVNQIDGFSYISNTHEMKSHLKL